MGGMVMGPFYSLYAICLFLKYLIIICLSMFPLLGHRPSLCITHKEHVCLYWSWVFLRTYMYVFTKKILSYLESITQALLSAYLALDSPECKCLDYSFIDLAHHQPINVPTAGAQAFLMDYPQGERAITHHAGPVIGGC
jgi:hypothetical protein